MGIDCIGEQINFCKYPDALESTQILPSTAHAAAELVQQAKQHSKCCLDDFTWLSSLVNSNKRMKQNPCPEPYYRLDFHNPAY